MRKAWRVFRAIVSVLLLLVVILPAAIYVLLSLKPIQEHVRARAMEELSQLLGAEVSIDNIEYHPFNTLSIEGISMNVDGDTVMAVETLSAGFRLMHLVATSEFVFDYALVDGAQFKVWSDSIGSPLNIDNIIKRLKSDKKKEKRSFSLEINTVAIRNATLCYDVRNEALPDSGRFSPAHICISDIALNAYIPQITDKEYSVAIDHLSFKERSGFEIERLEAQVDIRPDECVLSDFDLRLNGSVFMLEPISIAYESLDKIGDALLSQSVVITTKQGSCIYPPDFRAFVPALSFVDQNFNCDIELLCSYDALRLKRFRIQDNDAAIVDFQAQAAVYNPLKRDSMEFTLAPVKLYIDGPGCAQVFNRLLDQGSLAAIKHLGMMRAELNAHGNFDKGSAEMSVNGAAGDSRVEASYSKTGDNYIIKSNIDIENLNIGVFSGNKQLGLASFSLDAETVLGRKIEQGSVHGLIHRFDFKGYSYSKGKIDFTLNKQHKAEADFTLDDPAAIIRAFAIYDGEKNDEPTLVSTISASNVDLEKLGFDKRHPGYRLGAKINLDISDLDYRRLRGSLSLSDFYWLDRDYKGLRLERFSISANPDLPTPEIVIKSPIIEGRLSGAYDFSTLPSTLVDMAVNFVPVLSKHLSADNNSAGQLDDNCFSFDFTLKQWPEVRNFFNLPFDIVDEAQMNGRIDAPQGYAYVNFDAPYLYVGGKFVQWTSLFACLDVPKNKSQVFATTQFGTKKGDMSLVTEIEVVNSVLDTHIDWAIERDKPINGSMEFHGKLEEMDAPEGAVFPVVASIDILPGTINFGDETWRISRSTIDMDYNSLALFKFGLDTDNQSIAIHGTLSPDPEDIAMVSLSGVRTLPIFETLDIDKALIGGRATGNIAVSNVFSGAPVLECPKLHVDSISYNHCAIGNADIAASWNNDLRAFELNAAVKGFEGKNSQIEGFIFPMDEALDINFDADSIPVGFLKPFMSAFASDISGRASGNCRLFGTFKSIDLEGDVFAENVKLGIDFTNTSYTTTDSIHMRPGKIMLNNLVIRDVEGHTAKLSGYVEHKYFKEPRFKFDITKAENLLSYNITSRQNPDWYGTIYGNGGASVEGYPGVVNISVNMSTAPKSTFTFVLNDRLDAEDYSFLTFRDVTPDSLRIENEEFDEVPSHVRSFQNEIAAQVADEPSKYNMDISVTVNPDADMRLVMDPAAGDEITARGSGTIHMIYKSSDNDLNIWGRYIVTSGNYHFTLQDIIVKNFAIKENSEIKFDGDPYAVKTDITAVYSTHANLSDLDESFLEDTEVARTQVPVNAIMKVSGDIRQPQLDFDLEFPSLSSDTYRKVRSIVSTTDMMNRQIIYLLALNRFYTPDYMTSTTKGNELFSVASSTISSQLGNMLGKLSDNWSIAPNLRSDRGDFSDVEVDVALTSRLLNNRLIFNGNFGYRDKTLNTNQFVGDFDIEYLLNKRGNWRLKAYNRYNDRNFYFRSALTTQGIGIMFKRDFDKLFNFLKK